MRDSEQGGFTYVLLCGLLLWRHIYFMLAGLPLKRLVSAWSDGSHQTLAVGQPVPVPAVTGHGPGAALQQGRWHS